MGFGSFVDYTKAVGRRATPPSIIPRVVKEIQDIEAMIPGFSPNVVKAYSELKADPGSPMTPPGAAP